jgi:hypothetical protein
MSDIGSRRKALTTRILDGEGAASCARRRAAYDGTLPGVLLEKVRVSAHEVTEKDVVGACESGASEDEVFELVICAAVGEATRQLESALAALDVATSES